MSTWPDLAVIMPVLNEEKHIVGAVNAILAQDYPGKIRVVLALGPSTDRTDEIVAQLAQQDSRISSVVNKSGRTPDGLNAAIDATTESIVVRVDAHSELSDGYLTTAVKTLQETEADNVGGIMAAQGVTRFERAVAVAMTSKLGVGSSAFHVGGTAGPAETVYLGVFQRSALARVGGYDPTFTRAQDWEMNYRIRQSGGKIWFNPDLKVIYRPRSSFRKLANQYFQYGQWRRKVMATHPDTVRRSSALRYFAPPLAVCGSLAGLALGSLGFLAQISQLAYFSFALPAGYLAVVLGSTLILIPKAKLASVYLPFVLLTMQFSWGVGFLRKAKS